MARLHTSFVLGYHGCQAELGEQILAGTLPMQRSRQPYDWLGEGIYFWEADPTRAWEWADEKVSRGVFDVPFVIGAAIDLRNCLDLMARESLELLLEAYSSFKNFRDTANDGHPFPENQNLRRNLDCAVINHLHGSLVGEEDAFDTVRGLFVEGGSLFPGSGFQKKTHVQIAVRNPDCLKGLFRVPRP